MTHLDDFNRKTFAKKVWIAGAILSLIVILILLFKTLLSVLLLILAGALIAIYFHGFAGIFEKWFSMPPKWSLVLSVLFNLALLVAFFWFVGARLENQVAKLSQTLPQTIQHAQEKLSQSSVGREVISYLRSTGDSQKSRAIVSRFFSSSFGVISDLYIVILLAMFFTITPGLYKRGIVQLLPPAGKEKGSQLLDQIKDVLKKWLVGQIIGFFFIAILTALGLFIMDMPLILTLALLAGLLNFIPNFGPIIALIPAVLLALLQGPMTAVIIAVIYTAIQIIQSAVTQPLIQKKMVNIPPALMIIGQVGLGLMAGLWGVLLAVPLVVILMTIVDELYIKRQNRMVQEPQMSD